MGASIGIRLNDYLDEYELRHVKIAFFSTCQVWCPGIAITVTCLPCFCQCSPPLSSLTKRIKKFDWTDEITTIVLIVLSTLFALIAPVCSSTASASSLILAGLVFSYFASFFATGLRHSAVFHSRGSQGACQDQNPVGKANQGWSSCLRCPSVTLTPD